MTRSEVISIVNTRTEQALVGQVDFDDLFADVLQEFCAEHRFWWLKKRLSFSTVASTATYDLTSITTTPTGAGSYVDEITSAYLIDPSGNPVPLSSVFSDSGIMGMITNTQTGQPSSYRIEASDLNNDRIVRLDPMPNGIYTIHVLFWAMPDITSAADDTIPVVPTTKHHILKTALEKEVWRLKYGEQDPKFVTAVNLYTKKVSQAKKRPQFATDRDDRFINQDEEAIRSTGR